MTSMTGNVTSKIDIRQLVLELLDGASRRETMVSLQEIRAMAMALYDFDAALIDASLLIQDIAALSDAPAGRSIRREIGARLLLLGQRLRHTGHLEARHVESIIG